MSPNLLNLSAGTYAKLLTTSQMDSLRSSTTKTHSKGLTSIPVSGSTPRVTARNFFHSTTLCLSTLPKSRIPPYCLSQPHKAKSFTNDSTILSSKSTERQSALSELDHKCDDLGLTIRPDKCFSLALCKGSVIKKAFNIDVSKTTNLCDKPPKFLGSTIAVSSLQAKKKANSDLVSKVNSALSLIDKRPIRGEYKLWIYKHYLCSPVFEICSLC